MIVSMFNKLDESFILLPIQFSHLSFEKFLLYICTNPVCDAYICLLWLVLGMINILVYNYDFSG